MGLKSDRWIRQMAHEHQMIVPFVAELIQDAVISYGLSSYGYDIRVANQFKALGEHLSIIDPKNVLHGAYTDFEADVCIIPPGSAVLARSVEYFRIPRNVAGLMTCKSTYARAGVLIPTTVLEPGWEGIITIAIVNTTPLPAKVYANEGVAQVLFFEGDEPCDVSYADRSGKYQAQDEIIPPRVD